MMQVVVEKIKDMPRSHKRMLLFMQCFQYRVLSRFYGSYEARLYNNTFLHEVNKSFPGDNIYLHAKVTVNGFEVRADIALTGEQQAKGLDIKNNLTENQGMFFVFQQPDRYGFWMKGMIFPIDIIWLDRNGTVTHIEHSLKPCPPANSNLVCPTYFPEKDSLYVLETVPGFSMKHNVRLGKLSIMKR